MKAEEAGGVEVKTGSRGTGEVEVVAVTSRGVVGGGVVDGSEDISGSTTASESAGSDECGCGGGCRCTFTDVTLTESDGGEGLEG